MSFCSECGAENTSASNFCKSCGNNLIGSESNSSAVDNFKTRIESQPQRERYGTSEVLRNLNSKAPFFFGLFVFSFLTGLKGYEFNISVAESGLSSDTYILLLGFITLIFYGLNYWCVEIQTVKKSKPTFALVWGILFFILVAYSIVTDIQYLGLYNFYDYLGTFCNMGILYGIFSIYKEVKDKIK